MIHCDFNGVIRLDLALFSQGQIIKQGVKKISSTFYTFTGLQRSGASPSGSTGPTRKRKGDSDNVSKESIKKACEW